MMMMMIFIILDNDNKMIALYQFPKFLNKKKKIFCSSKNDTKMKFIR